MEELAESIGKLSMNAKEWRPPSQSQQHQQTQPPSLPSRTSSLPALPIRPPSSNLSLSPLPQRLEQRHYSAGGIWQHQNQQQQQQQQQLQHSPTSDLTAVSVNEFVPGRGWGGAPPNSSGGSLDMPWRASSSSSTSDPSGDSTSSYGQQDPYGSRPSASTYSSYKLQQQPQSKPHASTNILPSRQAVEESDTGSGGGGYLDDGNDHSGIPDMTTLPAGPSPAPPFRSLHTMAVSDDLWRYHRDLALESHRQMVPADPRHKAVPPPFVNAFCLDPPLSVGGQSSTRSSFGYPSITFQVTSGEDGYLYCLRRFDNVRSVSSKIAAAVTERWTTSTTHSAVTASLTSGPGGASTNTAAPSNNPHHGGGGSSSSSSSSIVVVQHPGVVRFRRCFCAQRAVFFVHDYIPGARTLRERSGVGSGGAASVPEPLLWSAVSQLVSALRAIHSAKLAVRCLTTQHILFNKIPTSSPSPSSELHNNSKGRLRLRINCLGVVDALEFEARKNVVDLQRDDVRDLGRLIVTLATGTEITRSTPPDAETMQACEMYLAQHYSRDLHSLAMTLIRSANPPTIIDVSRAMAGRIFDELDGVHMTYDRCEQALASEYESGRALRLLLKLGFINERPEFGMNRRWAQSGDCYVLTLFRDYVFHQADGAGNPVMDLGHVITAMNKLDAADEEKIVLASRDGKSLLVVTYADVARCLDNAFLELCAGAVSPAALQY